MNIYNNKLPSPNVTCSGGGDTVGGGEQRANVLGVEGQQRGERWAGGGLCWLKGGGGGSVGVGEGSKGAIIRAIEGEQRGKRWGWGGGAQRNLFAI